MQNEIHTRSFRADPIAENKLTIEGGKGKGKGEGIVTSSQGINDIAMTDWGLRIYFNIPSLANKSSVDRKNSPWKLEENQGSIARYDKGSCPVADRLSERSILPAIPSCLTAGDEQDIVRELCKVLCRHA